MDLFVASYFLRFCRAVLNPLLYAVTTQFQASKWTLVALLALAKKIFSLIGRLVVPLDRVCVGGALEVLRLRQAQRRIESLSWQGR